MSAPSSTVRVSSSKGSTLSSVSNNPSSSSDIGSSSSTLESKKIQKKIDKKKALKEFNEQIKSKKPMLCPSCKQTDHSRSTSKLCPYRKEKKVIRLKDDDYKVETFTIKSSLKNTCMDARIIKSINNLVEYTTKVIYVGSLFANYVILKRVDANEDVPIINQDFVYALFSTLSGNGNKAPKFISQYLEEFKKTCQIDEQVLESLKSIGYATILSISAKQYETLIRNHVCENHERRSTRFFLETLSCKTSEFYCRALTVSQRKSLAHYIYGQRLKEKSRWPSSVERTNALDEIVKKVQALWAQYQQN